MFAVSTRISAIALFAFVVWLQVSAEGTNTSCKGVEQTMRNPHAPRPAAPPNEKELRHIIALSRQGGWALLGVRWLVADGKLKTLLLPQKLLYPSPITFFDGRNTLLFAHAEATGTSGALGILDVTTGQHRDIAFLAEQPHVPAPSPDKQHVAYVSAKGRLAVIDLRTREVTGIAPAWKSTPSWSPTGQYIAFEKNKERDQGWGYSEVAIASFTSGNVNVLDKGRFPSWSPKSDLIAYTDVDGKQLKVIDSHGAHGRVLKKDRVALAGPIQGPLIWSPDGTKLIFCRVHDDLSGEQHTTAYLLDIGSGSIKRLGNDQPVLAWR